MPSWRQAAQARLDAATPGPWEDEGFNDGYYVVASSTTRDFIADVGCANDVDLIIHAPTELRRALGVLAEMQELLRAGVDIAKHVSRRDLLPEGQREKLDTWWTEAEVALASIDAEERP